MKKILCMVLALMVALSLVACTSGDADKTPADNKADGAAKADADYTGKLVVYSPHDADPLNAGVAQFREKYPNIEVESLPPVPASCASVWWQKLPILRAMFSGAAVPILWLLIPITLKPMSAPTTM